MRLVLEVHFILVANLEGAKDSASMKTNVENEREEGERKGKKNGEMEKKGDHLLLCCILRRFISWKVF